MKKILQSDLKSLIHEHSLFFDKLVELIPARFYLPVDDLEKKWFHGLSKAAKAYARKESKDNIKKARRARLDPEKASTTLDQLKKSLENEKTAEDSEEETNEHEGSGSCAPTKEDKSITYEELRQKLRCKIEELSSSRNARSADKVMAGKRKENSKDSRRGKRKRTEESAHKELNADDSSANKETEGSSKNGKEIPTEFKFGHVKLDGGDETNHRKKRKLTKQQTLEQAKKLEEAKKDPEKGEMISKKHSWSAATSRAAGVKVHDDPKLLKQTMKKEKQRNKKSVGKWKERLEGTEKARAAKQQTRAENIAQRAHQKKMRKIAKREKKLMRPGFEGRKEGFINDS